MSKERFQYWVSHDLDNELKQQLNILESEKEIEDAFYRYLAFGTGGLRGVMGVGTNRMNIYTVAKATCGLCKYLLEVLGDTVGRAVNVTCDTKHFDDTASGAVNVTCDEKHFGDMVGGAVNVTCDEKRGDTATTHGDTKHFGDTAKPHGTAIDKGVVIAYDSRHLSFEFARCAALCINSFGIKSYIFKAVTPAPMLSFAVNHLGCAAGIVITASHNPPKYNGYKVYDETGCQITQEAAEQISRFIMESDEFIDLSAQNTDNPLYNIVGEDVNNAFYRCVLECSLNNSLPIKQGLKAVYSPLHGSGNLPVREVLRQDGFNISVVKEQEAPDGNFPTVKTPNPEDRQALTLAIEQAKKIGADIAFGTDPDCDRIGVAVKQGEEYTLLTGNQIGALLIDYILYKRFAHKKIGEGDKGVMAPTSAAISDKARVIKTIVTNELGANIARSYGIEIVDVLTGFKYIGEKISQYTRTSESEFLFGYEESFGFLIGTYAKDKDAVGAAMLLCEMAAEHKSNHLTLIDRLNELYKEYGYFLDALNSFEIEGIEGANKISNIMANLRQNANKLFCNIQESKDYSTGVDGLPKADVLKIFFADGSWLAARPSGTEPKIKFYYSIRADNKEKAAQKLEKLQGIIANEVKR